MRKFIKRMAAKSPPIRRIILERDTLKSTNLNLQLKLDESIAEKKQLKEENIIISKIVKEYTIFVPPGHFYSPIPSKDDIKEVREKQLQEEKVYSIELRKEKQFKLLKILAKDYSKLPFPEAKIKNLRYFFKNPHYSYCDGIFLFLLIMYLKPNNIIEVGSGFSSCLLLDTNDLFFNKKIKLEFVEPYPELLLKLISSEDQKRYKINTSKLQDVPLKTFERLKENDILFIDSTHVSKLNSDVNYLIHTILPNINKGVYIHIHDIFWPFEYPKKWLEQGRAWNESYVLRAFLEYNENFEIVLFNDYLQKNYPEYIKEHFPKANKNRGGSIWIKKIK